MLLRGGGTMRIWQQLPAVAPRDLNDLRQQCLLPGYGCRGLGDGRGERGGRAWGWTISATFLEVSTGK